MKKMDWIAISLMFFGTFLLLAEFTGAGFFVWAAGYLYITVRMFSIAAATARSKGKTGWVWGLASIIKWYPLPIVWLAVMYWFKWRTKEYKDMVREKEILEGKGERPRP